MKPAFSVIFFTTLAGAGQGLFLALYMGEVFRMTEGQLISQDFMLTGLVVSFVLLLLGLTASTFHLGHPMRGWRAVSQWRTSWLSREVIALPLFIALVFFYMAAHYTDQSTATTLSLGLVGIVLCFALFVCTAMIYACLKFLREWHSPLTLVNFILLGTMSGFTLAASLSASMEPSLTYLYTFIAVVLTVTAFISRLGSLARNKSLRESPKSTVQTAIGVRHPKVQQRSMGFMGGSFNTREFFHGKTEFFIKRIRTVFITMVFILPLAMMILSLTSGSATLLIGAFCIQYVGLLAERWFFFAEVNHPQNLYYQTIG
ncbi:MAG: dimethyl sulfoxide reductase anchor subunit [Gammaproteobacteria bacterium]|nr:dimethyl sulfoxide reductase anchor subunit [Gammaproteobacteria bacterium]MDH5693626.1 dimethyl sulfoxide reductase anchor subunit [Gammaproteobacteria bacterium]